MKVIAIYDLTMYSIIKNISLFRMILEPQKNTPPNLSQNAITMLQARTYDTENTEAKNESFNNVRHYCAVRPSGHCFSFLPFYPYMI